MRKIRNILVILYFHSFFTKQIMTWKKILIFTVIATVTTVWWFYKNTTSDFVIDGIAMSSATVTLIAVVASTVTWLLLSWASVANKENVKVITSDNLLAGALSCYVGISFFSGWMGPMAGIVFGILSGAFCYGMFSIIIKISSRWSIRPQVKSGKNIDFHAM